MKRDFSKLIAEGSAMLEKHERMDMTLAEATALLEGAEPGGKAFTLWDAYRAGVAIGARISKGDSCRERKN